MSKTVLLIEDNALLSENTTELLELHGYKVLSAPCGQAGIKILRQTHPDLVLCDIVMPVIDGYTVLHELHKMDGKAEIPFIFLTSMAEKSEIKKGMQHGADGYLTKPFSQQELFGLIEFVMEKKGYKKD